MTPFTHRPDFVIGHHDPGRVGRAGQQDAVRQRRAVRAERLEIGDPVLGRPRRHRNRLQSQCLHQVAIGRISRGGDGDPVAAVKGGKKGQRKAER